MLEVVWWVMGVIKESFKKRLNRGWVKAKLFVAGEGTEDVITLYPLKF